VKDGGVFIRRGGSTRQGGGAGKGQETSAVHEDMLSA
jgi:hypothetical protein